MFAALASHKKTEAPEFPEPMQSAVDTIAEVSLRGMPIVAFFIGQETIFCAQHPREMSEVREGKLALRIH